MAQTLYPVSGVCYDADGTTVLANTRVDVRNSSLNTAESTTTNAQGEWIVELANIGFSNGDSISIFASYGRYFDEKIFTVDTTIGSKEQNLTLETLLPTAAQYCSVNEVREYTNVQESEFSDKALSDMINRATDWIDEETGRTWKSIQTITDEYYNGNGTTMLCLNNTDIQSVTAVSIDNSRDGVYEDLTVDDDIWVYEEGYITINTNNSSVTNFTTGDKTVKVSYTYGSQYPSETVRELCILNVANRMHLEGDRSALIEKITKKLMWKTQGFPV